MSVAIEMQPASVEGNSAWLLDVLERLDDLLAAAVGSTHSDPGVASADTHTLNDRASTPAGHVETADLESLLVAMAIAPEVNSAYGNMYAHLQGDGSRRLPTVGLALDLVAAGRSERMRLLQYFSADSALVDNGLVEFSDPAPNVPLPSRVIRLSARARRELLGEQSLDAHLDGVASLLHPSIPLSSLPLSSQLLERLAAQAQALTAGSIRLQLTSSDATFVATVAAALAAEAGRPVLEIDANQAPDPGTGRIAQREAAAQLALLHLRTDQALADEWRSALLRSPVAVVSAPTPDQRLVIDGFSVIDIPPPSLSLRRRCWTEAAAAVGNDLSPEDADDLAASYRLGVTDIADAARIASVRRQTEPIPVPTTADFREAASDLAAHGVASVARRVEICHGWDDLVLEDDATAQLEELCARVRHRDQVIDDWKLGRGASGGFGTHALFSGPSGTGKTAAAQVLAGALGFQLWKVDLARVVSKYIGETEKNLDAIFEAAEGCDVVLLFDEADALFGKRSEVKDAHDRYANIEISYLLQRMEEYDGVTVLATNLRHSLDEAFLRRLAFDVRFPFPDEEQRLAIWQRAVPPEVPVGDDVDLPNLAALFTLSGGQIRNVVLAAAYLAVADDTPLSNDHLYRAVRREFQKLGKDIDADAQAEAQSP